MFFGDLRLQVCRHPRWTLVGTDICEITSKSKSNLVSVIKFLPDLINSRRNAGSTNDTDHFITFEAVRSCLFQFAMISLTTSFIKQVSASFEQPLEAKDCTALC